MLFVKSGLWVCIEFHLWFIFMIYICPSFQVMTLVL